MLIEGLRLWVAGTNAWLVAPAGPGGECVLIDAPPDPAAILGRLRDQRLKLVAVLATHGHIDHIGGIAEVVGAQAGATPVRIHDEDRHMLLDPIGASGTLGELLAYDDIDLEPPELIFGLEDGERVSGAGMTFTALHTPGHTRGSTCFLLEVEGEAPILFSGDHLFKGSIGRTDLPGGSREQLLDSMVAKILPMRDDVQVLPGHGDTTTVGDERATNPFLLGLAGTR
ncbi:MAG: MBL fold metallo-hydrolase [Actinobacteria bacterium]|nr:MBL fold metallo-hydrolase [Actinomycetota bacterium]